MLEYGEEKLILPQSKRKELSELKEELEIRDSEIEVEAELSRGAFSSVHSGIWNGRPAALKFLKNETQAGSAQLLNEAAVMKEVSGHENLVAFFGLWKSQERWVIVIKLVQGGPLGSSIDGSRRMEFRDKLTVICKCWRGLVYLNIVKHVLHCDLHPGNILISEDFRIVKITDFGLSKIRQHLSKSWTSTEPFWHYYYTAPEVARIGCQRHRTSDVFSMGVVTAELFSEHHFWNRDLSRTQLVLLLNKEETPFDQLPIWIEELLSEELRRVIEKAIHWQTTKRHSAPQILEELEALANQIHTE